jgi:hypothetical protein
MPEVTDQVASNTVDAGFNTSQIQCGFFLIPSQFLLSKNPVRNAKFTFHVKL